MIRQYLHKTNIYPLLLIWVFSFSAVAQTPQFSFTPPGTTVANNIPTGNATSTKRQCVYYPSDFGTTNPGYITKLYVKMSAVATATYSDLTIKLGTAPLSYTTFTSATQAWLATDTVFYAASVTLSTNSGNWYEITLPTPYYYDNTSNLIFELSQSAYSTSYSGFYASSLVTARSIYGSRTSATASSLNDRLWQFGFDLSPLRAPNNASLSGLVSPLNFCAGTHDVAVRLKNRGNNLLNTVTIQWKLDDTLQTPVTWTTPLDTMGGTSAPNDTAIVLGTGIPFTSARSIKAWTELPNGVADTVNIDDTIQVTVAPALNGIYSIGGTGAYFATINDAVNSLNNYGVCGPVILNVTPGSGPYTSNLAFSNIKGVSDINTILFNGNGSVIQSANSPVISFSGSSYITLDSFTVINTGTTGYGVHIGGQSHHLTIRNSKINVGMTATAVTNGGIIVSGSTTAATTVGNNGQHITIENNEIIGGYYGIALTGSTGYANNTNNKVRYNKVQDFYAYGIYTLHGDSNIIEYNELSRPNRSGFTTTYVLYNSSSRFTKWHANKIHSLGTSTSATYPIGIVNSVNTVGQESEITNNLIYNIQQAGGAFYGIYALTTNFNGFRIYHNTIDYEVPVSSTGIIRGFYPAVAPNNVEFKNNIINITGGGTGVKTGIYVTTTSASFTSNNNVIYVNTSASNNVGYWTAARATLLDWQTASSQDAASVAFNPAFASPTNPTPLSINIDNIGIPIPSITTDITGALRSALTPDAGAIEFTGISGDLRLVSAELKRASDCYSANDTIILTIQNLIGSAVDFTVNPLTIDWNIEGPVNSFGSTIISTNTLSVGNNLTLKLPDANRTMGGVYTLKAYLSLNAVNTIGINDTLSDISSEVRKLISVLKNPANATATGPNDTIVLTAQSPLFPGGGAFFSEICHWRLATGATPAGGWPSFMLADDYVEITGVPNSDLAGYTMEEWIGGSMEHSVTFPTGTVFSPSGTLVVATGQLGSSVPSPANFYYHNGNTVTHNSGDLRGYILKSPSSTIVDATTYGAYVFPAAAGVTSIDWSGSNPGASSAGIRLIAPDNNTNSSWVLENASSRQDPLILNSGTTAPLPGTLTGFTWYHNGAPIGTSPQITVGPYTTAGTYVYVAEYTNICGTFYDTVYVTASATVPVRMVSFEAKPKSNNAVLTWVTASENNNNYFDVQRSTDGRTFETIGKVKGSGTTQNRSAYAYTDENAAATGNIVYYRLKQVDYRGASEYSKIAAVDFGNIRNMEFVVYPNPFSGQAFINATASFEGDVTIQVLDVQGRSVSKQVSTVKAGTNQLEIQGAEQLEKGFYFIKISNDSFTKTNSIIKN